MRKYLYLSIVFMFLIVSSFLFFGCSNGKINPNDIDYIEFREGSLKTEYGVDENLDFDKIYIVIVLKDNKGDIVEKVLPSMMEGFDTSTTTGPIETRSMRAKFMGHYTTPWNYIVTNTVDINTLARIRLDQEKNGNKLEVKASIDLEDLSNIKGFMMDITYNSTNIMREEIQTSIDNWELSIRSIRQGSLSILYYAKPFAQPINDDSELFVIFFDIIDSKDYDIEIKNIIASDGDIDIHLPNVQ